MHVSLGSETLDDGTFPPEDVCAYYDKTGKCPTTSGSTPYDFESVYDRLFAENPGIQILHLAYSAVTTCSYHSCELAIEGKPYAKNVRIVDTKHVSVGQCAVVVAVARWLRAHPEATLEEAAAAAVEIGEQTSCPRIWIISGLAAGAAMRWPWWAICCSCIPASRSSMAG